MFILFYSSMFYIDSYIVSDIYLKKKQAVASVIFINPLIGNHKFFRDRV